MGPGHRHLPRCLHSVLAGRRPCLLHRVRGALPAPLLHPADPEPPGADTQGRVAGPPACGDVRTGGCAAKWGPGPGQLPTARLTPSSALTPAPGVWGLQVQDTPAWTCLSGSDSNLPDFLRCLLFSTTQGLSMTKHLLHTKCLPAAHIPSPHLPRAPGAATGGTAVPAALTTGCQALPAGFPSALGWGWGGRLTPLSSPGALARSPQHRPLGKNRKTPGAGCFSDSVPQGPK